MIEDPVDRGHCQQDAGSDKESVVFERQHLPIEQHDYGLKILWVENFVTCWW